MLLSKKLLALSTAAAVMVIAGCSNNIVGPVEDDADQVSAAVSSAQDDKLKKKLDALVKGVADDAERFKRIKDTLSRAVDTWYKVPAATAEIVKKPYRIRLKTLKCLVTEDNTGDDETSLDVYVDNKKVKTFKKDMNNGDVQKIDIVYEYSSTFSMKLYDRDNPGFPWYDDHDYLGTVTVKNTTGNDYTAAFNRDGALYIITYNVAFTYTPAISVEQQKALVMNDYFNQYLKSTQNVSVSKSELFSDVAATIKDPFKRVYQASTSTCGTSATILQLARKFPKKFVESCWEVYATDKLKAYNGKTYTFTPTKRNDLSASDWILTGIVNPSFTGTDNTKLQNIIKALLPYKNVGTQTTYMWGEEDAIRRAAKIVKNGGAAFLKINSKMISQEYSTFGSWVWQSSNHIVVMLGDLNINHGNPLIWDSGHFTFNYWSWGKDGYMMYANEGRFEDGFLGMTYAY